MLTPKSRQFIMQRGQQFCRSGKYKIPISKVTNKSTGDLGISDEEEVVPLRHRSERAYYSEEDTSSTFSAPMINGHGLDSSLDSQSYRTTTNYDEEEMQDFGELENLYNEKINHHRLDVRLKQMMLNNYEDEDDIFFPDIDVDKSLKWDSSGNVKSDGLKFDSNENISINSNSSRTIADDNNPMYSFQDNFLEEIAAKAMSDDDYCDSTTNVKSGDKNGNPRIAPQLPEVLMGLGPSTSKQNFFTISTTGAITPDICHFYVSPNAFDDISTDTINCKRRLSFTETTTVAEAVAYGMIPSLFDSSTNETLTDDSSTTHKTQNNNVSVNVSQQDISVISATDLTSNDSNNYCNFNNEDEMVYVGVQQDEDSSVEMSSTDLLDVSNFYDEDEELPWRGPVDPNEFAAGQYSFYKQKFKKTSKVDSSAPTVVESETIPSNVDAGLSEFVLSNNDSSDEQQVPILDSWENLDDDSVAKMADKVIKNFFLIVKKKIIY